MNSGSPHVVPRFRQSNVWLLSVGFVVKELSFTLHVSLCYQTRGTQVWNGLYVDYMSTLSLFQSIIQSIGILYLSPGEIVLLQLPLVSIELKK